MCVCVCVHIHSRMHIHKSLKHIYFTACGPPKHQRVMSGRRKQVNMKHLRKIT